MFIINFKLIETKNIFVFTLFVINEIIFRRFKKVKTYQY